MKKIFLLALIVLILTPQAIPADNQKIEKLISQFKGDACHWNLFGKKTGFFDRWTTRHFDTNCKIAAAQMLGEMGQEAKAAVPILIEALKNGPNDIETGDGILPYRSTIVIALGKIGDPRAIDPLIEKLKYKEKATLSSGASFPPNWKFPVGIGQKAVVEALGMFGPQAKGAIPYLEELKKDCHDEGLKNAIEYSLERIM